MLNGIFVFLIGTAVLVAAFTGTMAKLTADSAEAAKTAVTLALSLVGQMALWLGLMRVLREAGMLAALGRRLAPVMGKLFPSVPADHPAMSAMIMNIGANMLGLGNAATPFGLKAMRELDRLNPRPGVATDAMAMFLAINTSGVAVLPLGVIAVRASLGAHDLGGIIVPSILATTCSTLTAVMVGRLLQGRARWAPERFEPLADGERPAQAEIKGLADAEKIAAQAVQSDPLRRLIVVAAFVAVGAGLVRAVLARPETEGALDTLKIVVGDWLLPVLMLLIVAVGFMRRVKVYEVFIQGAKEGFDIAITIIPFLVAILVAIAMFRGSGAMGVLVDLLAPVTSLIGMPAEALPMALIRPLSGSGAMAVLTDTIKTHGPDSFVGFLVSVMNGSTETTFYVLALYYGSVSVRATRHTLWPCLAADAAGLTSAVLFSYVFWRPLAG